MCEWMLLTAAPTNCNFELQKNSLYKVYKPFEKNVHVNYQRLLPFLNEIVFTSNSDTVNDCRRYFDFKLLSEVIQTRADKFLPARRYASAGNSDRNVSVRLSVRLSVTRRYCVKTKKASGMISSPSGSPKTLVFWGQISSPNSKGFPPNGGLKQGSVEKIQRFFSFKRLYLENGKSYY